MRSSQDLNLDRYYMAVTLSSKESIEKMREILRLPFGNKLFIVREKIRAFIICGFKHKKSKKDSNYHLYNKLCRYKTWDNVKINRFDKLRFRVITGYKFEN